MRTPEVIEQLPVRGGLLQRVELGPVEVFEQGVAQHRIVAGVADDRGDRGQLCLLGCAPPTLAHDELVALVVEWADDDGLE